jgi:hypothetical protein
MKPQSERITHILYAFMKALWYDGVEEIGHESGVALMDPKTGRLIPRQPSVASSPSTLTSTSKADEFGGTQAESGTSRMPTVESALHHNAGTAAGDTSNSDGQFQLNIRNPSSELSSRSFLDQLRAANIEKHPLKIMRLEMSACVGCRNFHRWFMLLVDLPNSTL